MTRPVTLVAKVGYPAGSHLACAEEAVEHYHEEFITVGDPLASQIRKTVDQMKHVSLYTPTKPEPDIHERDCE
ncbi:hypothetical protein [Pseudolysinimonas sp.]|uniref:hypothetical protein n=1 Tax=Pseudolysinimonas sp. TaxID=2680009 RepID=UPI003F822C3B